MNRLTFQYLRFTSFSLILPRGHGNTTTIDDLDLSTETLANDIIDVIEDVVISRNAQNVDVVLVGHSMGGALAVHAALQERPIGYLVCFFHTQTRSGKSHREIICCLCRPEFVS